MNFRLRDSLSFVLNNQSKSSSCTSQIVVLNIRIIFRTQPLCNTRKVENWCIYFCRFWFFKIARKSIFDFSLAQVTAFASNIWCVEVDTVFNDEWFCVCLWLCDAVLVWSGKEERKRGKASDGVKGRFFKSRKKLRPVKYNFDSAQSKWSTTSIYPTQQHWTTKTWRRIINNRI